MADPEKQDELLEDYDPVPGLVARGVMAEPEEPEREEGEVDMFKVIDLMDHDTLAWNWRFAPPGDPLFQPPYGEYARKRLDELGGITAEQSKRMGWGP